VYGRPVTLESGDQVWVSRADVEALQAWASVPGQVLTLTLADARVLTVMFRHHDGVAVEARPVVFMAPLAAAAALEKRMIGLVFFAMRLLRR
jgi:hypothetical protein